MNVLNKLQLYQKALKLTRGKGFTSALAKLCWSNTNILVIAGQATKIPNDFKTDWDTLKNDVIRTGAPVFIDNGKLQELLTGSIEEILALRQQLIDNGLVPVTMQKAEPSVKNFAVTDVLTNDLLEEKYPLNYGPNSKLGDSDMINNFPMKQG